MLSNSLLTALASSDERAIGSEIAKLEGETSAAFSAMHYRLQRIIKSAATKQDADAAWIAIDFLAELASLCGMVWASNQFLTETELAEMQLNERLA